ncbi:hypothetical protein Tco_0294949 [Tanacetum coccineum]
MDWNMIINHMASIYCGNSIDSVIRRMSLAACVYLIWQERNLRICRDEMRSYKELAEVFSEIIRMRVLSLKVKSTRVVLNVQRSPSDSGNGCYTLLDDAFSLLPKSLWLVEGFVGVLSVEMYSREYDIWCLKLKCIVRDRVMELGFGNLVKLLDWIFGGYLYMNAGLVVGWIIVLINNLDASNPLHIQTIDNDLYMGLVYSENAASVCELEDALTKFPKRWIYEVMCSCDDSKELVLHQQLMKLMQFSMGLDDCYQPIKSALLTRDLLLEVKDAYTTVSREESYIDVPESSSVNESKLNATFLLPNLLTIIEGTLTIIIQLEVMWPVLAIGVQILI